MTKEKVIAGLNAMLETLEEFGAEDLETYDQIVQGAIELIEKAEESEDE